MEDIIDSGKEILFICNAQHVEAFKVLLDFSDGVTKIVNLEDHIKSKEQGTIFDPLRDAEYFKTVYYNPDTETIEWENGADFAPEFLYEIGEEVSQDHQDERRA